MSVRPREDHVKIIISEPLEIIEQEHGLAGIDHVIEIAQERRTAMIFDLEKQRNSD